MSPEILITVADKRWKKALPDYEELVQKAVVVLADNVEGFAGEVSILLSNDSEIQNLNRDFRGKDKPTNVLSFPQDEPGLLGDIAFSLDTLEKEVDESGKKLADHFVHLLIHGGLHLVGYDHNTDSKQAEMEEFEVELLQILDVNDPYNP